MIWKFDKPSFVTKLKFTPPKPHLSRFCCANLYIIGIEIKYIRVSFGGLQIIKTALLKHASLFIQAYALYKRRPYWNGDQQRANFINHKPGDPCIKKLPTHRIRPDQSFFMSYSLRGSWRIIACRILATVWNISGWSDFLQNAYCRCIARKWLSLSLSLD